MKFIINLFSLIFSILFTIILTVGIFTLTCNLFLSKENINMMVDEIGIESFIESNESNFQEIDEEYLKIPEVKELIDKLINSSIDYIMNDKGIPQITDDDVNKIVNSSYYETELGIKLTEEEKNEFTNNLKEQYITINETFEQDLNSVKNELFEDGIIKTIFSSNFKFIIIGSLIILLILIGICRWSLYRPLSWIGTSSFIAGLLSISGSIIVKPIVLESETEGISPEVINKLFDNWITYGIISIILGVVLIIIYFLIRSKFGKSTEDKLLELL